MAVKIGTLSADMTANSASFIKNIGKAQSAVNGSSYKMNKSLGGLKKGFASVKTVVGDFTSSLFSLHGGLGAVAGAAGLGLLIKRSIETADTIAKTADKVGIATSTLQELRYGAQLAGVEQKTLDMAMQRFARRVGEAANGTGELVGTLEQYNIKVRNSDGSMRSLEAIMGDYANTIKNAESDQERLRLAFKAFDSEGAALVNLLRDGEAGLAAMRKEAQSLGVVIDESLIRNAEKANDKLDIMSKVMSTKLVASTVELAPTIIAIGDNFVKILPTLTKTAGVISAIGAGFVNFIDSAIGGIKDFMLFLDSLNKGLVSLGYSIGNLFGVISDDKAKSAIKSLGDAIAENDKEMARWTDTVKKNIEAVNEVGNITPQITTAIEQGTIAQKNSTQAVDEHIKKQDELKKSTVTLSSVTGDLMTRAQNSQINGWKDVGKVALDVLQDIINAQIKSAQTSTFNTGDIGGGISSIFSGITSGISGAFSGFSIPGFASGGEFTVSGGPAGTDKVPVSFMATNGERVRVETPQQQRSSNAGSGTQVVYNIDARGAEAGVEQRIMQVLKQLDASIESRAVNAVRRKNIRNPSFLGA